jgi:3-hydroxypropanoate dehydrogenase
MTTQNVTEQGDTATVRETQADVKTLDDAARELLFTGARTSNSFTDRPVTEEQLREIYELMKWGPTWANTLPLRITYITTPEGKERLLSHMQPGNVEKTRQAPVNAVLAVDNSYHHHIPRLLPFRPEMRDMLEGNAGLRDEIRDFGGASQAAYFIIAVRAAGLAAGPMGGFDAAGLNADLFPDGDWSSILVVNIGYPGENPWFDRLPRFAYDEAVRHL